MKTAITITVVVECEDDSPFDAEAFAEEAMLGLEHHVDAIGPAIVGLIDSSFTTDGAE